MRAWARQFMAWLRRPQQREQDLRDKIAFHFSEEIAQRIEAGQNRDDARTSAYRGLGNIGLAEDATRQSWAFRNVERLAIDLRVSLRALRRSAGFAVVSILTLTLGIGSSTALFSVVNGVLLRPLPYRDADRLVIVLAEQDYEGARRPVPTYFPFAAVAAWPRTSSFESLGFYAAGVGALAGRETTELVDTAVVAGSFFDTVGGEFVHGRGLEPADDLEPAAVISERLWTRAYARNPDVLGQTLTLNGQTFLIIGVTADAFRVPQPQTDVWIPVGVARTRSPTCCSFTPLARLARDVGLPVATQEVAAFAPSLAAVMPRALGDTRVEVVGLQDRMVGASRVPLLMLMAAVGLLLLLACGNVMNLLLARNTARLHEMAVRRALGASRARLVTHALAETAVLTTAGGLGGTALALLSVRAFKTWSPSGVPRLDSVEVDGAVLLFVCAVIVAATVVVGLLPALQSSSMAGSLRASRGGWRGTRTRFTLRTVTAAQLAISMTLLVGAVLLGRSLVALRQTDLGIFPGNVATASLNLMMSRTLTDEQQIALVDRVVERIASLPGVTAAGVGTARPPNASRMRLTLNRSDDPDARASYQVAGVPATPGYFRALGVRLERGRFFNDRDDASAAPVVMMSVDTARQLFGDEDPLHRTIELSVRRNERNERETMTVVGLTANVKYSGLDQVADAVVYRPFAQQPFRSVFLVARTTGDPSVLASQLQREVAAVDRAITTAEATTLDAVLSDVTSQPRFRTVLLALFAVTAIAIAAVGLYGVIAYSVAQRTGEIGVRMALGADRRRIRIMVLREGVVLALVGGLVGVAGAYGATRMLANLLYGIAPTDPTSFTVAAAGVIAVGLLASYIPAVRAAGSDPVVALRQAE